MVITASCGAWLHDGKCQDKEENNTDCGVIEKMAEQRQLRLERERVSL